MFSSRNREHTLQSDGSYRQFRCELAIMCDVMRAGAHIVLLALLITGCGTGLTAEDNLLRQIQGTLTNKPVVLRNFYASDELTYDSQGGLAGNAVKGTRLADGSVRIDKVSLRGNSLEPRGSL